MINITQPPFNAKGDGVTDDTDAIQAAINSVDKALAGTDIPRGAKILIPSSLNPYIITKSLRITSGIHIEGEGDSSLLHWLGNGPLFECHNDRVGMCHDFSLRRFSAYCPLVNKGGGFFASEHYPDFPGPDFSPKIRVVYNFEASELTVSMFPGRGFDFTGIMLLNSRINKISFRHAGASLIYSTCGGTNHIKYISLEGNNRGLQGKPNGDALIVMRGGSNHIEGCLLEGIAEIAPTAYDIEGYGATFRDNYCEYSACADNFAYKFGNGAIIIDHLHMVNKNNRAWFHNNCYGRIETMPLSWSDGAQNFVIEKGSFLHVGTLISQDAPKNLPSRLYANKTVITSRLT